MKNHENRPGTMKNHENRPGTASLTSNGWCPSNGAIKSYTTIALMHINNMSVGRRFVYVYE